MPCKASLLGGAGHAVVMHLTQDLLHATVSHDRVLHGATAVVDVLLLKVPLVRAEDPVVHDAELSKQVYPTFRGRSTRKFKHVWRPSHVSSCFTETTHHAPGSLSCNSACSLKFVGFIADDESWSPLLAGFKIRVGISSSFATFDPPRGFFVVK